MLFRIIVLRRQRGFESLNNDLKGAFISYRDAGAEAEAEVEAEAVGSARGGRRRAEAAAPREEEKGS